MNYKVNSTPQVGAAYSSASKTFIIESLPIVDNQQWVHYFNKDTCQQYSCLLEAFLARFTLTV